MKELQYVCAILHDLCSVSLAWFMYGTRQDEGVLYADKHATTHARKKNGLQQHHTDIFRDMQLLPPNTP